jgi:hypothetical protein
MAYAGRWLAIGASETEMIIVKQASWNTALKHTPTTIKSIKRE